MKKFHRKILEKRHLFQPHDACYPYDMKLGKPTGVYDKFNNEIYTGDLVRFYGDEVGLIIAFKRTESESKKYIAFCERTYYSDMYGNGNMYDEHNYYCRSLIPKNNGEKTNLEIVERYLD